MSQLLKMDDDWDSHVETKRRKSPMRHFFTWTLPIFASRWWRTLVHEPWYYTKCRLWHRYNVIRIRTLPPTWMDRDEVLLHAAFQILTDFVEREQPFDHFDTENSPHKEQWQEIRVLYDWWKTGRKSRPDPMSALSDNHKEWTHDQLRQSWKMEDDYGVEDEQMLIRLMKVRMHLWT